MIAWSRSRPVDRDATPDLALENEHPLLQVVIVGFVLDVADAKVMAFDNREDVDQRTALCFGRVVFQLAD